MADEIPWWRTAVVYQVYLRSFADSDGDGIGDLNGLRSRLDHIRALGVDAVWLNPCYPSPQRDHGYDIADYMDIDPAYGTLADFDALVADAHNRGLRVLMDLVANHCSSEHPWFRQALRTRPGSGARARFLFRDGRGPGGSLPPNDWQSVFGGPAWTRIVEADGQPGQWYLHLFDATQPDFDWRHPQVRALFEDVLRFWFGRGIDGFRLDVAHGLLKHPALPDWPAGPDGTLGYNIFMWNQPEVHHIYRDWRRLADTYPTRPSFIGEVWVPTAGDLAQYTRADELHQTFYFDLLAAPWNARAYREAIGRGLTHCGPAPTWTLANHDVPRTVTRLGTTHPAEAETGFDVLAAARRRGEVDLDLGDRRARAAVLLSLALPGSVYLYQGEELGLPEVLDFPEGTRQDPIWHRSGGLEPGRDGCRVPLPWTRATPTLGFSPPDAVVPPWLPQPAWYAGYTIEEQEEDALSFLSLNRRALTLRRELWNSAAPLTWLRTGHPDTVAFARGPAVCVTNFGPETVAAPAEWGQVRLASTKTSGRFVPPDCTAWLE